MTLAHPFDELRIGRFEAHGVAWINYERCGDWTIGRVDLKQLFDEEGEAVPLVCAPALRHFITELMFSHPARIHNDVIEALRDEDRAADRGCDEYHFNRGAE